MRGAGRPLQPRRRLPPYTEPGTLRAVERDDWPEDAQQTQPQHAPTLPPQPSAPDEGAQGPELIQATVVSQAAGGRTRPPLPPRLRALAAVAEHGGVSAAARALGVHASTVSRHLSRAAQAPDVMAALDRAGVTGDFLARIIRQAGGARTVSRVTWKGATTETHRDADHRTRLAAVDMAGRLLGLIKQADEHQHLHLHPRQILAAVADLPPDYLRRIVAGEGAENIVSEYRALRVRQLREGVASGLAEPSQAQVRADQEPEHLDQARAEPVRSGPESDEDW